nr:hypothetical protein [Tanacetum cinerariifolium]
PEDIYAAVDSCETAQVIWLRVQQMMKGYDIGIQEKKAKFFNEWEKFTSNEGESIESYYHRFLKLMNDLKRNKHFPEKIVSNLKFLNNLQPEWSRHVTIVHQTKDLHTADYTQLYDFLKYNQKEVDELKAKRLAKTQDPLALMANSNNPYAFLAPHQDQPSFNQNYMQQPMPNPEDITDPTTAINMALALMAKAFKLKYSTPTNNNQRISSNPRNRKIAQLSMNMGQDRQMQMVGGNDGNQFRQYAGNMTGNQNGLIGVQGNGNQNQIGNGNLVAARTEGNAAGQNGNQIRCYNCRGEEAEIQLQAEEYNLMAVAADLDEIEEVNANCILMANLQQASTSEEQYTKLLEPILESHQVPQNDNDVISKVTSVEQSGDTVEQHPANFEKTRVLYESLYQNLAIEVEKVNSVNRKLKETNADLTNELARFKNQTRCFEISQEKYDKLKRCYQQSVYQEQCLFKMINAVHLSTDKQIMTLNEQISELNKQLSKEKSTVSSLLEEKKKLKSDFKTRKDEQAAKFVVDFKSLAKEADESLAKHKALELEIERLLKAVVSKYIMNIVQKESVVDTSDLQTELERMQERFENCIIKKENEYDKLWNDWYKKCDECKYDKISYDKAYKDMQQKIEWLQAQLGDLKVTSNSVSTPQESKGVNNDKVIAPGMFRINPFKTSREEKHVPNTVSASARTKSITVSQAPVITKKDVNSDKQKAKVSVKEIQKKYQAKVTKPKKVGFPERLATPKLRKPKFLLRWSPTGRLFDQEGKLVAFSESESQSDCSNGDNSCTSNTLKPKIKRFPNFTSLLDRNDLVSGLPKLKYHKEHLCPSCEQEKSKRASHPPKHVPNSRQRLHLLHMDLCGPMRIASINGKWYVLVIVDDYSRYTWVHFLRSKDEAPENQVLKEYFDTVGISHQMSYVQTPQQNRVVGRRNRTLVEAARTMLIFSRAPLFLWAEAIATACFTQNRSIIHRRFNKTPYKLINGRKPNISFLYVFGAPCYPKNDREDIGKLGAKGDIGFFIGYSADSCAYRIYNRRTKKIMKTINVSFDELSAMAFEQHSLKPGLQNMTSGQISSGLDLTYAPSTITTQQPTEDELDLLFEAMYDDYIGGQPSATGRTVSPAQEPQVRQSSTASTIIADTAPTPTNLSSHTTNIPITSQDVDELNSNAMVDGNTSVNPFANLSTSVAASSSSQNVDLSNMHTFYQPYPHEFQWTKDHPLEQVIGEPS